MRDYRFHSDERTPYDPNNPYQQTLIRLMPHVNFGLYKPLQDRMEKYMGMMMSKNRIDRGEGGY